MIYQQGKIKNNMRLWLPFISEGDFISARLISPTCKVDLIEKKRDCFC